MYTFSKPKYEVYPYSQHDIPPSAEYQSQQHHLHYLRNYPTALIESDPNYFQKQVTNELRSNGHTSVEIQPSHSYEIKQTEHGYKTIYHGDSNVEHSQDYSQSSEGEAVPVIVLRVPGPARYASHLQALLQEYLEARAAQYIQTLQEQEAHGIDASHQQIHEQEQPDINAYGALPVLPYGQTQAYVPAQMFIQPLQPIQPYFSQPLQNPYASAHIAQPIDLGADHIAATPAPASYYSAQSAHSDESGAQHSGTLNLFNLIHINQKKSRNVSKWKTITRVLIGKTMNMNERPNNRYTINKFGLTKVRNRVFNENFRNTDFVAMQQQLTRFFALGFHVFISDFYCFIFFFYSRKTIKV